MDDIRFLDEESLRKHLLFEGDNYSKIRDDHNISRRRRSFIALIYGIDWLIWKLWQFKKEVQEDLETLECEEEIYPC